MEEGDVSHEMFFLSSGRVSVRLMRDGGDEVAGDEIAVLCDGHCFGEIAFIVRSTQTAFHHLRL